MINNITKIERLGYISNPKPHVSIEKPFSKTHAPVFGLGVLEKF
jgi:hypothetical protein